MFIESITIAILMILCIFTVEAMIWAYVVYNHARWMISEKIVDKRKISYPSISFFAMFSSISSFICWIIFIYLTTIHSISILCICMIAIILLAFQLLTIHTWYLISSLLCIPLELIPFVSKLSFCIVNKFIIHKNIDNKDNIKSLNNIFNNRNKYNSLIINFLDIIPDMVWVKDIDNRFVYVNKRVSRDLLLSEELDVLDKTSTEIAYNIRDRGTVYTFGELCCDSDEITKDHNKPTSFYEYGDVDNKFIALKVLKSPIYNKDGTLRGTIGIARDVSHYIKIHDRIERLFKEGKTKEGINKFLAFKQQFIAMKDNSIT